MKTVIVASYDLWPTQEAVAAVAALIAATPILSEIWVRGSRSKDLHTIPASPLEAAVINLSQALERKIGIAFSGPGGRAEVFKRDYRLVENADLVAAFFAPEQVMENGTGHVVHAALNKGIPVEAWTLDDHANLINIGSDDGIAVTQQGAVWLQQQWSREVSQHPEWWPLGR